MSKSSPLYYCPFPHCHRSAGNGGHSFIRLDKQREHVRRVHSNDDAKKSSKTTDTRPSASNSDAMGRLPLEQPLQNDRKHPRISSPSVDSPTNYSKFACPFFKRDLEKYRKDRICSGPGWGSANWLKVSTKNKKDCCEAKTADSILRNRDGWQIYHILFPADDPPSSYYDLSPTLALDSHADSAAQELAYFEEFCHREFPKQVKRELEMVAEQESTSIKEILKRQIIGAVRSCQSHIFESYREFCTSGGIGRSVLAHNGPINDPPVPPISPSPPSRPSAFMSIQAVPASVDTQTSENPRDLAQSMQNDGLHSKPSI
ncbi:MAG: hypothetical protein M1813_004944 [Trichoglossum hirsutum]|nr:MAG: hypothetical protein M1813_004944 [Trichoglossum hirsutum]